MNRKAPLTNVQLVATLKHPNFARPGQARWDCLHNYRKTRLLVEEKLSRLNEDSHLYFTLCQLRRECLVREKLLSSKIRNGRSAGPGNGRLRVEKLRSDYDNFIRSVTDWFELEDPYLVPHLRQAL